MELSPNPVERAALKKSAAHLGAFIPSLKDARVLITGAAGFIGRRLTLSLLTLNLLCDARIKVTAHCRSPEAAEAAFGALVKEGLLDTLAWDVSAPPPAALAGLCPDFVVHAASPAHSALFVNKPADTIAAKMGFGKEKFPRLRSGILYTLNTLSNEGHCFATREQLQKSSAELLEVDESYISMTLDEMIHEDDVILDDTAIYLPPFYHSEVGAAKRLYEILNGKGRLRIETTGLPERIRMATGMTYDDIQMQAIMTAVQNKILILTGGPGTGKTTTTLGIITAYKEAGADILLAAPTGRAAKRLSEATGLEAKTIHRLLEFKPPEGYQRNGETPLEGDVLIVDECSMIDIMLMYNLLKAIPDSMTLILVGDIDQLPSVGAGNVLRDIIESDCFPVVRLTRIFRQAQQSRIVMNAHRINSGKMPDISNGRDTDFFFMQQEEPEAAANTIVELVKTKLSRYYKTAPSDIQVLTPMQRGVIGAANLNQVLQTAINPEGVSLRRGGFDFRARDKVMQIRNNYDKEVFNGDIGVVEKVDLEDRALFVRFDDRLVEYDATELDELVLAYATTIHKAQGSEYPIVVMPVMMSHYVMLQRNLIYTGITRAKKALVIVGTKKALAYAVHNVTVTKRNTMLRERLQKLREESAPAPQIRATTYYNIAPSEQSMLKVASPTIPYGKSFSREDWLQQDIFARLARSNFRSKFGLADADKDYVRERGLDTIQSHAEDIIAKRLAPASIPNDGKQTPMRGHPVFIAQHATATCCRSCLEKWYGIPQGRELTVEEQSMVIRVIMQWIERQMK